MDLYRARTMLWLADAALAAAAAAVAIAVVLLPVESARPDSPAEGASATSGPSDARIVPARPLDHYAVTWQRDLRRPVLDAPAGPAAPKAPWKARLVGTILEQGFTRAVFADAQGQTVLCAVGEKVEGAEVKSIDDGAVTVLYAGEVLTLTVDQDKDKEPKR